MITYALFNVKGGAGKTTTAVNLAHIFATQMHQRVLLVDLDPQSNSTSFFSTDDVDILRVMEEIFVQRRKDVQKQKQYPVTVGDLLLDRNRDPHDAIYPTRFPGLDLMPSDLSLSTVEVQLKANLMIVQQTCLRRAIQALAPSYDICILDLSPSINLRPVGTFRILPGLGTNGHRVGIQSGIENWRMLFYAMVAVKSVRADSDIYADGTGRRVH